MRVSITDRTPLCLHMLLITLEIGIDIYSHLTHSSLWDLSVSCSWEYIEMSLAYFFFMYQRSTWFLC